MTRADNVAGALCVAASLVFAAYVGLRVWEQAPHRCDRGMLARTCVMGP